MTNYLRYNSEEEQITNQELNDYSLFELLPITELIESISKNSFPSKENLIFCYKVIIKTIKSLLEGNYSHFDAVTTTNCCHGISLLTNEIILSLLKIDLNSIRKQCKHQLFELENKNNFSTASPIQLVPKTLIDLACLYILCYVKEFDSFNGSRTNRAKIKNISPLGTKLCNRLIKGLQKRYANLVAHNYYHYLNHLNQEMVINGLSVHSWGKYVNPKYLRVDCFGTRYASNLYSMQVSLAYLIKSQAKIAIINDIIGLKGKERYVGLFQGNGKDNFIHLKKQDIHDLNFQSHEPLLVFGGCAYSYDLTASSFEKEMIQWMDCIPSLILACDVFYPQFPKAAHDPNFSSAPIDPSENDIKETIVKFQNIKGFSSEDPSLFCLAHIYTVSVREIVKVILNDDQQKLPRSSIPLNLLSKKIIHEFQL